LNELAKLRFKYPGENEVGENNWEILNEHKPVMIITLNAKTCSNVKSQAYSSEALNIV
jgi:hypothetical protein